MCRLAFIAEHGMRSYKPFQARSCRERVWADPDVGAILTIKGLVGAAFFRLFLLL